MAYKDDLKDGRWQKKRLEIMQRDEFKCTHCGDSTKTLNVHHKEYIKGKKPWDYDNSNFLCLCETCHENIHNPKIIDYNQNIIDSLSFLTDEDKSRFVDIFKDESVQKEIESYFTVLEGMMNNDSIFHNIINIVDNDNRIESIDIRLTMLINNLKRNGRLD